MKQTLITFYVVVTCIFMPLYYENGYFNTLDAKAHIFWATSGVTMGVALVIWCVNSIMTERLLPEFAKIKAQISLMDIAMAAFGMGAVLSCLFSDYKMYALTGSQGWNIGAWTIFALVFTYFYISRNYVYDKYLWIYILVAASCLYFLGFCNGLGLDPLGLHTKLSDSEMFEYIATIGNINSYSGYLSLSLPLLSMVYIIDSRKWLQRWLGVALVFGFMNLVVNNSDGAFLGAGLGLVFMVYYCLKNPERYGRLLQVGMFFGLGMAIMRMFVMFWPIEMVELSGLSNVLTQFRICMPLFAVCLLLFAVYYVKPEIFTEKLGKVLSILFAIAAIAAVVAIVAYTAMHFTGSWGTKRGWIWEFAVTVFAQGSLREKIFGVGPECFSIPVMDQFSDFISEHWGKRIANAHNEFLQYLVTMGLVGLISYCAMWLSAWREYVKRISWREEKAPFFFAIMGYMGQAIVNNPQALNMATLFLFFGIYRSFDLPHEEVRSILDYDSKSKKKKKRR
mgnify:CR=1 FL=1